MRINYYGLNLKQEGYLGSFTWVINPSLAILDYQGPNYTTLPCFPAFRNEFQPQRLDFFAYLYGPLFKGKLLLGTQWQLRRFKDYETTFYFKVMNNYWNYPAKFKEEEYFLHSHFTNYSQNLGDLFLHTEIRYDKHEAYSGAFSHRFELASRINPKLSFLLSYTDGFQVPSFFHKEDRLVVHTPLFQYRFKKLKLERKDTFQTSLLYLNGNKLCLGNTIFLQRQKK